MANDGNPGVVNLSAYWKLDEDSGFRYDSHRTAGVLKLADNNTVTSTYSPHRQFAVKAANFNAANFEYLSCIDNLGWLRAVTGYSLTLGAWVKPHDVATPSTIVTRWDGTTYNEYNLRIHNSKFRFTVWDPSGVEYFVVADDPGVLTNNTWYFVCCTYYEAYDWLYIHVWEQGDLRLSSEVRSQIAAPAGGVRGSTSTSATIYVGAYGGAIGPSGFFDGLIDELWIYRGHYIYEAEKYWLYNYGQGRTYSDLIALSPPTIEVETESVIPMIEVFDDTLTQIGIIEDYYSLSWAERYDKAGDFELELPIGYSTSSLTDFGNILYIKTSDKLMIIEDKKPESGEDKTVLLVNGRSAESILARRILQWPASHNGSAEWLAYKGVLSSVVAPVVTDRAIDLFDIPLDEWPPGMFSDYPIDQVFDTETVLELIEQCCSTVDLGFKIVCDDLSGADSKLYFYVYEGVDHSTSQTDNDWVIFSEKFNNVLASSFYSSDMDKVNIVLVKSDDIDPPLHREFVWIDGSDQNPTGGTEPVGLERFEARLDTSIDRDIDGDDVDDLTDAQVLAIIQTRGEAVIRDNPPIRVFEGDFESRGTFTFGVDFFLGDIVQCNIHGIEVKARIIELVRSYSVEGEKVYLAFDFLT